MKSHASRLLHFLEQRAITQVFLEEMLLNFVNALPLDVCYKNIKFEVNRCKNIEVMVQINFRDGRTDTHIKWWGHKNIPNTQQCLTLC